LEGKISKYGGYMEMASSAARKVYNDSVILGRQGDCFWQPPGLQVGSIVKCPVDLDPMP
jgi:hypothetical protein